MAHDQTLKPVHVFTNVNHNMEGQNCKGIYIIIK